MLISKGWSSNLLSLFMSLLLNVVIIACGSSGGGEDNTASPAFNLTGSWTAEEIVHGNCSGDEYPITLTEIFVLNQNGNNLILTLSKDNTEFNGTISGNQIQWNGIRKNGDGKEEISFTGTVSEEGNRITGTAQWTYTETGYTCSGTTEVEATRSTEQVDDVSGLWEGTWDSFDNTISGIFTADIVQSGSELTGKISVPYIGMEDTELKGTVSDGTMVFGDINDEIVFTGTTTLSSTSSGTFTYSALNIEGSWQAYKTADTNLEDISWQTTELGITDDVQGKIIIGDGRNDGITRVYTADGETAGGAGNLYEFSHTDNQWQMINFGTYEAEYGNDNLTRVNAMTIGPARNDEINRLYASGEYSIEFAYYSNLFNGSRINTDIQWTYDLIIGDVRQDGLNRIYLTTGDAIYELTFTENGWHQESIVTGFEQLSTLLITEGRNDTIPRLYAGTSMDNHIYEFTWSDGQWQMVDCGAIDSHISIDAMDAGSGRNDGINRIYIAGNGGVAELSYDGTDWQSIQIGAATYADALAVGAGRSDGTLYLYVAEEQNTLVEYAYTDGWYQSSVLVSDQKINGIAIGNGKNDNTTTVYATAEDNYVYEFIVSD
jgi:hypothetical protein